MKLSLNEYLNKEERLMSLDNFKIFGNIPIWRIVRTRIRGEILNQVNKTVGVKISFGLLYNVVLSFIELLMILLRRKHYDNLIFPHPRLFKIDEIYVERLTDPIIDYSDIGKSYIIFERWQNGVHKKPRIHSENCIYWDFVPFISLSISKIFRNHIVKKYRGQINGLISELSKEFEINDKIKSIIDFELSCFIVSYVITAPILKACSSKRIFVAPRVTFDYIIALAKKYGIASYELQHGITLGPTSLYSGKYNNSIDPDYFLTFGIGNVSEYFGIPIDRIINIGYAFGNYIKGHMKDSDIKNNRILIISEPRITDSLLKVMLLLVERYPTWDFDFRCHPQEALNNKQKAIIESCSNLHEVSNDEESFSTISKYPVIIGENSSVLFEALFLGKKVGRLNFNGLKVNTDSFIQGGFIINTIDEFELFINTLRINKQSSQTLYSEFQPEVVNQLK